MDVDAILEKDKRADRTQCNPTPPSSDLITIFFFSLTCPFLSIRRRTRASTFCFTFNRPTLVRSSERRKEEAVSGHEWVMSGQDQMKSMLVPLITSYLIRR